ncbi:hypothetical protein [Sinosporangium siamense]|uniref:Uncharacterized protein n=1 Tax=Sinosporangium siamense TaxID=1367973 RepID=A0A919RP43_9ACTN|nr:hypothetical protein [Sinosporangium siamense]GII95801.1 hypothetical protein Ssi02_60320 [Sinosporangium siamense]
MKTHQWLRYCTTALLIGAIGVVLVPGMIRGPGIDHLRLAGLTVLVAVQFLVFPFVLAFGAWRVSRWSKRPAPPVPGYTLGTITMLFGALVVSQAAAVLGWLEEGPPRGVGDPDGELAMTSFALLSGALTLLAGLALLWIRKRSGANAAGKHMSSTGAWWRP